MEIVKEEFNVKSFDDRRKRVNRIVVSYLQNGSEHRKGHEFDVNLSTNEMLKKISYLYDVSFI